MSNSRKHYLDDLENIFVLDAERQFEVFDYFYNEEKLSWGEISQLADTYPNKVRRLAKKIGIESRSYAEAQALALQEGRQEHPTKGKAVSKQTKEKISIAMSEVWDSMTEAEREQKRIESRERWFAKPEEERQEMSAKGCEGIRRAAKEGSRLERFVLEVLSKKGYDVDFHRKHWSGSEQLEIDIYVPELNVAIEVDGPSHFRDIWGEDILAKNKSRDQVKNGLLLAKGCVIIRIRQDKSESQRFYRDVKRDLLAIIEEVTKKWPAKGKRMFTIGDVD